MTVAEIAVARADAPALRSAGSSEAGEPCAHRSSTPLYGGLLLRCPACGLVRTGSDPRFLYDESYFVDHRSSGYDFDSVFARASDQARFGRELERLEAEGLRGRVLDVGCATGSFLAVAQARGWQVCGVEIAEFARRHAEQRLGVPVHASLDDLASGERFDLVTLHHVLEHVHEPVAFLRDALRPRVGRRLLVEVPNFASLASRAEGARWHDLRPEQHVHHFEPQTLCACLRAAGFRVLRIQTLWEPLWCLRAALRTLRWLPHLALPDRAHGAPAGPVPPEDPSGWRPPKGVRRWATEASRVALLPLVRGLERAGLAERLAIEAEVAAPEAARSS